MGEKDGRNKNTAEAETLQPLIIDVISSAIMVWVDHFQKGREQWRYNKTR
jgi:hypothetical protein